jgi:hypothetical protein
MDVEKKYVLFDNQTEEEEKLGCLQVVFEDGEQYNVTSFSEIRELVQS